jgi:sugar phosphate isomerase/epimerase
MPLAAFPKCFLDDLVVHRTMSVEQWIDLVSDELDVDGLEFYWGFVPHQDPGALRAIRERLEKTGLPMAMMCYSPDFTKPDAADRQREVELQEHALATTAALGGAYCRVLSGQRRPGLDREEGLAMVADCIVSLLPAAERHGVHLILENHYKDGYWDYPEFAQRADVFLDLLDRIPESPWFGVNYDPSNALIGGDDQIELLEAVAPRVLTMHASDRYLEGGTLDDADPQVGYASALKHGVIGQGANDYDAIFGILSGAGFRGWVSIEDGVDPEQGVENLRASAEFLRAKMKEHGLP